MNILRNKDLTLLNQKVLYNLNKENLFNSINNNNNRLNYQLPLMTSSHKQNSRNMIIPSKLFIQTDNNQIIDTSFSNKLDKYGLLNFSIEDVVLKRIKKTTREIDCHFNKSILCGLKRVECKNPNINWNVFTLNSNENNIGNEKQRGHFRKKILKSFKENMSSHTDRDNLPDIYEFKPKETNLSPLKKRASINNCPFRGIFFLKLNKNPKK